MATKRSVGHHLPAFSSIIDPCSHAVIVRDVCDPVWLRNQQCLSCVQSWTLFMTWILLCCALMSATYLLHLHIFSSIILNVSISLLGQCLLTVRYAVWLFELKTLPFSCFTGSTKTWFDKERLCWTIKGKNGKTSLPLYSYQFPRLVASPHQDAAVRAIPQLLQGGVAIHYPSRCFHPLVHLIFSKTLYGLTALARWLAIICFFRFPASDWPQWIKTLCLKNIGWCSIVVGSR